tara:strand:+ start:509 stop:2590 length:2082 start_codon:yes stop_codon:yes gene_type:complete
MAADQTLVNAAFALGRSNVPGDYSRIFNKQYEGLIASQNARYKMYGDIAKTAGDVGAQMAKDNIESNKQIKQMREDNRLATIDEAADAFKNGSSMNKSIVDNATQALTDVKKEIEAIGDNPGFKERKREKDLLVKAAKLRASLVRDKGALTTYMEAHTEGMIDYNSSMGGSNNPQQENLLDLMAQVNSPAADHPALGISMYTDENMDLWIEGDIENITNRIYEANKKKLGKIDSGENAFDPTTDSPYEGPKVDRISPGSPTEDDSTKKPKTIKIRFKDLLAQVKYKDNKTTNVLNGIVAEMGSKGSQASKDFNLRLASGVNKKIKTTLLSKDTNFNYIATSPQNIQGGRGERTYKDDLGMSAGINEAIVNQLGLGSDILTLSDVNGDGEVNATDSDPAVLKEFNIELDKHNEAKALVIEKLTNPQTQAEREIAAGELANYWTDFAKQEHTFIATENEPDGVSTLTKGQQNKKNNLTTFINGNAGMYNGYNVDKENLTITSPDGRSMSPQEFVDKVTNTQFAIDANTIFKGDWSQGSAVSTETVTDPLNSNVYYETGEGGKINGGLIQDAYNKYTSGESFSTYDDSFTFTPKGSGWTVTGPTQDPKTKEFTGPVTTRSADEEEMVKKMGFKKQASRLGFEGIKEKTAATNPITDYKKEGDKWYYIKGGQKKEVDASNFERLEAQTLIALARGKK